MDKQQRGTPSNLKSEVVAKSLSRGVVRGEGWGAAHKGDPHVLLKHRWKGERSICQIMNVDVWASSLPMCNVNLILHHKKM